MYVHICIYTYIYIYSFLCVRVRVFICSHAYRFSSLWRTSGLVPMTGACSTASSSAARALAKVYLASTFARAQAVRSSSSC